MIGLDTNLLVRYFTQDDRAQTALAADIIERRVTGEDGPGFINLVTLLETLWVLRRVYSLNNTQIASVLHRLLQIEDLLLQNEREVFLATQTFTAGKGSFPDALIAALNTAAGCTTTVTFDQRAARLPGFQLL